MKSILLIVCVIKKKTLFIVAYVYKINMQLFINISMFFQSKNILISIKKRQITVFL